MTARRWRTETESGCSRQVLGRGIPSRGPKVSRKRRFGPGPPAVIGSLNPTNEDLLQTNPYDPSRRLSNDSELCEQWIRNVDPRFEISDAVVEG